MFLYQIGLLSCILNACRKLLLHKDLDKKAFAIQGLVGTRSKVFSLSLPVSLYCCIYWIFIKFLFCAFSCDIDKYYMSMVVNYWLECIEVQPLSLSLSLFLSLSIFFSSCLSLCLSIFLSPCLSPCLSLSSSLPVSLSVSLYLPLSLSLSLSSSLSSSLPVSLTIFLSIFLSPCLSPCLSPSSSAINPPPSLHMSISSTCHSPLHPFHPPINH
jgi:hypothetical protein